MSVIHEALKRAEREREAGPVPASAVSTAAPSRRRYRWAVAALGVPLLFLAGVYGTRHLDRSRAVPPTAGVVAAVPTPSPGPVSPTAVPRHREPTSRFPAAPTPAPTPAVAAVADADPKHLNSQAVAAFREGRPEEAHRLLAQALRLAPAMPEAHNNLGMVLQAQGRSTGAKEEYLRALTLLPEYPEALNNLGLISSEEGNPSEAIRYFERALGSKPGYSSAHLNLAIVYDKLGRRADAFRHYRQFLDNAGAGESELVRRVNQRLQR